jgi:TatD DNase family protein
MIDSHCHLYLPEFDEDRKMVLERGIKSGVVRYLLPAIDSETTVAMLQMADEFSEICFPMAGLHPCSVKENFEAELDMVDQLLKQRKFIAIGETGLDYYWDMTFAQQQVRALQWQAEKALEYDLPIVLHTRNATRATIEVIQPFISKGLRGVFHCFGGSIEEAKEIIDMGFYMGIGGVVTYKNGGLDRVLPEIGFNNIILETDAPYLAPVPFRGKRNESSFLTYIAEKIASIMGATADEVKAITTLNARKIFDIK